MAALIKLDENGVPLYLDPADIEQIIQVREERNLGDEDQYIPKHLVDKAVVCFKKKLRAQAFEEDLPERLVPGLVQETKEQRQERLGKWLQETKEHTYGDKGKLDPKNFLKCDDDVSWQEKVGERSRSNSMSSFSSLSGSI